MGSEPSPHGAAATRTPQPWPKVLSLGSCCHLTWWHERNTKPQACGCSLIHHSLLPAPCTYCSLKNLFSGDFLAVKLSSCPSTCAPHLHWSFHIAQPHSGGITPCLSRRSRGLLPWNLYKPAAGRTQLPRTAQLWVSDLPCALSPEQKDSSSCLHVIKKKIKVYEGQRFQTLYLMGCFTREVDCYVSRRFELCY